MGATLHYFSISSVNRNGEMSLPIMVNMSKTCQYVLNIKLLMRLFFFFFHTKSLKCSVFATLTVTFLKVH